MESLNYHRHVHNQCARAHGCVHVYDFCHDWTKVCDFASVGRSLNLERLSGMHQC